MAIEFVRHTQQASFHSPLENFDRVTVDVEVRIDPLTGRQTRIVPQSFLLPEGEPDIGDVVDDAEGCFFCPGSVEEVTPTYADDIGVDRGRYGEATSFPNLNPYGAHSNVVALTEDHFRSIDRFTPTVFDDGLRAAFEYVDAVLENDETATVASVNMNFLRPAGSSIIHPHLQTLVDDRGTNNHRRLREASRTYRDRTGQSYWPELVSSTVDGDRHLGSTGSVEWIAPFAPDHHWHVRGIAEEAAGRSPSDDGQIRELASGIVNVLDFYAEVGLNSFNFACYLTPGDPSMPTVIDLIGRSVFDAYYWSDSPFFTVLHDEPVIDTAPEEYGSDASERF